MFGKLNGVIEDTIPRGVYSVRQVTPSLTFIISPAVICGIEQANSVSSILLLTSATASLIFLPFSK
jgi:hypothetical protein